MADRDRDTAGLPASFASRTGRWEWSALALLLLGVAHRAYLLVKFPALWFCSDEGNLGLMMLRLIQGQEFRLFIAGESSGGMLGVLTAALIAIVGHSHVLALKLTALLYFVLFGVGLYLLGRKIYGGPTALIAVFLVSLSPSFLTILGVRERGPHGEALALLVLLMWLSLRTLEHARPRAAYFLWGLLAGFAWYTCYASLLTIVPCGVFLLVAEALKDQSRRYKLRRLSAALQGVLPGLAIGSLPYWAYCIQHGVFPPFDQGTGYFNPLAMGAKVIAVAFPILTGARWSFLREDILPVFSKLTVYCYASAVLVYLLVSVRQRFRHRPQLLLVLHLAAALFVFTGQAWFIDEPRYLIACYCTLPLIGAWAVRGIGRRSKLLAGLFLMVLAGTAAVGSWRTPPAVFNTIYDEPLGPLKEYLTSRNLKFFYANYWITYRLMFESAPDPFTPPALVGATYFAVTSDRYESYTKEVRRSPNPAYVTWPGETEKFEQMLNSEGRSYLKETVGRLAVFSGIQPPRSP